MLDVSRKDDMTVRRGICRCSQ